MRSQARVQERDLTRHLLAFARRQPLEPRPLNLNRLVADLVNSMLRRTLGEEIDIQAVESGGLWPAFADPALSAFLLTGPVRRRSGQSQRWLRWVSQKATRIIEHWLGQRHAALLVAFAMMRSTRLVFSITLDLNVGGLADAQATGIHQLQSRSCGWGCLPEPRMAQISAWESTVGRRCFLGARTRFFGRIGVNRDQASSR